MNLADLAAHGLIAPAGRPEIPGAPRTVAEVLDRAVTQAPDREALVGRHARLSYAELDREADRAAAALSSLDVQPGDRLAASLTNHTEIVVAFLGVMRLGAIWVGVNRALAPPEKAYILTDSGSSVLIAEPGIAAELGPRRPSLPALRHVAAAQAGNPASEWSTLLARSSAAARAAVAIDPFAPAAIAYTSGTTGFPKGAVHSQHNLLVPGAVSVSLGGYTETTRYGVCLPLTILNLIVLCPLTRRRIAQQS